MFRRATPILAAMFLVACGGGTDDPAALVATPAVSAPVTTPAPAPAVATADTGTRDGATVPAALQFSAPLVGGGEVEFGPSAGRPVLLWFWAPW